MWVCLNSPSLATCSLSNKQHIWIILLRHTLKPPPINNLQWDQKGGLKKYIDFNGLKFPQQFNNLIMALKWRVIPPKPCQFDKRKALTQGVYKTWAGSLDEQHAQNLCTRPNYSSSSEERATRFYSSRPAWKTLHQMFLTGGSLFFPSPVLS